MMSGNGFDLKTKIPEHLDLEQELKNHPLLDHQLIQKAKQRIEMRIDKIMARLAGIDNLEELNLIIGLKFGIFAENTIKISFMKKV